jgi:hypothetical protein
MYESGGGAYPSEAPGLNPNIEVGWKGFQVQMLLLIGPVVSDEEKKVLLTMALQQSNLKNSLYLQFAYVQNKLECLFLASLPSIV